MDGYTVIITAGLSTIRGVVSLDGWGALLDLVPDDARYEHGSYTDDFGPVTVHTYRWTTGILIASRNA